MKDERLGKLAELLVRYSIYAQKGEVISVEGGLECAPLAELVYEGLLKAGAYPYLRLTPASAEELFYSHGQAHHFEKVPPLLTAIARGLDGSIRISAAPNTRALSRVDPARQARYSKAIRPVREIILKKKWSLTLFPTQAYAQDAEMSLGDYEDFVFAATLCDQPNPMAAWKKQAQQQARLARRLNRARSIRIVGPDTDLTLAVKGRTFVSSCGHHNMPCGEVFTGPIEDSAEGHIRYDFPVCHAGREITDVRLVFHKGRVVEASASKNADFLAAMLDMDRGARYLGELGIGTNYGIQQFTRNILFDEKIGGTVHLAVGQSYEETGGRNQSALHWDMIKDLRRGGALYADGELLQKNGKFIKF